MVSIEKEKCIGCGSCVAIAPDIFKLENGKANAIKQPETDEEKQKVTEAVNICPTDAISA